MDVQLPPSVAAATAKRLAYEAAMGYYVEKKEAQKAEEVAKEAEEKRSLWSQDPHTATVSEMDAIRARREAMTLQNGLFGDLAFNEFTGGARFTLDLHMAVSRLLSDNHRLDPFK